MQIKQISLDELSSIIDSPNTEQIAIENSNVSAYITTLNNQKVLAFQIGASDKAILIINL